MQADNSLTVEEKKPYHRRLAKKRAQYLNEAFCPTPAGFSACR